MCRKRFGDVALFSLLVLAAFQAAWADSQAEPIQKAPSEAHCYSCGLRSGDEMWVVSTRSSQDPRCGSLRIPTVRQYSCDAGWQESSWDALCGAPALPTVMYVHGNRFSYSDSLESGWTVYRVLTCGDMAGPLRLVIWSWPSDQMRGPVRDARVKSARADYEGYFLGWYLGAIREPAPVSLIGYSLGARVILGGLQARVQGQLNGISLPDEALGSEPVLTRVALLAAAVDYDALVPGRAYGRALASVDRMFVTTNIADPVLRRYHLLEGRRTERALGSQGIANWGGLGALSDRIRQFNAAGIVGRSHDDDRYYASPYVADQLRRTLLWYDN